MRIWHRGGPGPLRDERGFTLPELLTTIAILGILLAIAMAIWNSVIESRRVDAAANQLASDMRLAHTRATNQLTDWRVVLIPNRGDESKGPDYYLMELENPYPENALNVVDKKPYTFPGDVKATQTYKDQDDPYHPTAGYEHPEPGVTPAPNTLSFEFDTDGKAWTYPAVDGSICVTVGGNPVSRVYVRAATAQVEIRSNEDCQP